MKRIFLFLAAALLLLAFFPGFTALAADEDTLPFVTDAAKLLSESEAETLNQKAAELTEKYGIAVRILTLDSIGEYKIEDFAEAAFDQYHLGYGEQNSCIMLMLSMEYRDYDIFAHGYGNYAFTDYGKERIADHVVPKMSGGDWYGAFLAFLEDCDEYLAKAAENKPVDVPFVLNSFDYSFSEPGDTFQLRAATLGGEAVAVTWRSSDPSVATVDANGLVTAVDRGSARIIASADGFTNECYVWVEGRANAAGINAVLHAVIALVPAFIATLIMKGKMKTVGRQRSAAQYTGWDQLDLRVREDRFVHRSVHRTRIETNSGPRGGGGGGHSGHSGGTSVSSHGSSHHSGKF
jgi:uncharacterized membrane protein YgcG